MEKPAELAAEVVSVPSKEALRLDAGSPENQQTRHAVLQRIDLMPIQAAQQDRLYSAVDHARGMGKIITIQFGIGRTDLTAAAIVELKAALQRSDIRTLLADPTAVLVVLGFADSAGTPQTNKSLSERRADRTVAVLHGPCGMTNVTHAIGMGGSEFLDKEKLDKNRVAEVWVVLP